MSVELRPLDFRQINCACLSIVVQDVGGNQANPLIFGWRILQYEVAATRGRTEQRLDSNGDGPRVRTPYAWRKFREGRNAYPIGVLEESAEPMVLARIVPL